jgi:hypothetical protein
VVLKFSKELEMLTRADDSQVDIKHCQEAIEVVKFSPDGKRLAVGSRDNFIDIYDTTRHSFHRLCRCTGHSSFITHLDWALIDPRRPEVRVFQSTDGAHELLYFDAATGHTVSKCPRDESWASFTCTLGFPVMGIWPRSKLGERAFDGTDINAAARGKAYGEWYVVTAEDTGRVKLFNYPCVIKHAPFRAMRWKDGQADTAQGVGYVGHSSHVSDIRFSPDGRRVVSTGGHDRAVFQWRVDPVAKEQMGITRRNPQLEAPVMIQPPKAVQFTPDEPALDPNIIPEAGAKRPRGLPLPVSVTPEEEAPAPKKPTAADRAEALRKAMREEHEYIVRVHTSDIRGAGTDANVFVALFGKDAEGNALALPEWRLDNNKNNFVRGNVDEFLVKGTDIGTLSHARLRHDNSGFGPGWHLRKVEIQNKTKGWQTDMSPQDVWMDVKEGDGATAKTLFPLNGKDSKLSVNPAVTYEVRVTTGDVKGAGTDANVFLTMFGDQVCPYIFPNVP